MYPSIVVGDEGTKGGLWCSPVAKTSRPTSSALRAIRTIALIRSCSLGVLPLVGSVVTSPTVKIPNCMTCSLREHHLTCAFNYFQARDIPAVRRLRGTG